MSNLDGARVLSLESRRDKEMATLIRTYGGSAVVAPAMREVALESNAEAIECVRGLIDNRFDAVVFLTGVGARALAEIADTVAPREEFVASLKKLRVIARGPKPVGVLKEMGVPVHVTAPEPNTWKELVAAIDSAWPAPALRGLRMAVQEYGEPATEFLESLKERGVAVTRVPVYRWALPDNLEPLHAGIRAAVDKEIDAVLFTTSIQVTHLFEVAADMKMESALREGLRRAVLASIGPTTSDGLRRHGLQPDIEASHPKMGILIKELADRCGDLLRQKRA